MQDSFILPTHLTVNNMTLKELSIAHTYHLSTSIAQVLMMSHKQIEKCDPNMNKY